MGTSRHNPLGGSGCRESNCRSSSTSPRKPHPQWPGYFQNGTLGRKDQSGILPAVEDKRLPLTHFPCNRFADKHIVIPA